MGQATCAAVGSTTFLSTLFNLAMVNSVTARPAKLMNDYKALVCIQLVGGNDSFNMLVPTDTDNYNKYANIRSDLALPQNELLPLNGANFGLHPNMEGVQGLYNQGDIAFVSNVGTLVEPMFNINDYNNSEKLRPQGMYSHSDQRHHWQTSVPQDRDALGWGGRVAEIMMNLNSNQNVSMNISLSGRNTLQSGENMLEYTISRNGVEKVDNIFSTNMGLMNIFQNAAIDGMLADSYSNIFKQTFSSQLKNSRDASHLFSEAIGNVSPFTTEFSNTFISRDLHMVAKVIAAQAAIGMNRQTFFISVNGWDNHTELLGLHGNQLTDLNNALVEFNNALAEINRQNEVTTFTISDFGRTLTSNGHGSDHAWGGHQMVMGGAALNGGQIHGAYPDLDIDANPLNISHRGRFIPTISTDEYFAELALWFGVSPGELVDIFPNIGNFYSVFSGMPPVGFMNV